jgi:hypothetical protein
MTILRMVIGYGRAVARCGRVLWGGTSLKAPAAFDQAEAKKLQSFAVRANSILAFIECDEEQRPKLRDAIVDAMLWAQTQPK